MNATRYVTNLASRGRYTFTTAQAREAFGSSESAVQAALRRLRKKGEVAVPARGFHVIVPAEYRNLGCLPASDIVPELMAYLKAPYYAGLLTAAEIHGAAHHKPQAFQVVTSTNRRPLGAGRVRIVFIAKSHIEQTPTIDWATDRGFLRVSTPEATAADLVTYTGHSGGLDNVATVIAELSEQLDRRKLEGLVRQRLPMVSTQRLGYLLDLVGRSDLAEPLAAYVRDQMPPVAPLHPAHSLRGSSRDKRWRLGINVDVEPDV